MLVKRILDDENPLIAWGSGNQRRSYLHAFDCARIMHLIMENPKKNIVVNIGTKETISVSDLVRIICKISGKDPTILFDKTKPEGRFIKSSDTTILSEIIGDEIITVSIEEGIKKMINWYIENF